MRHALGLPLRRGAAFVEEGCGRSLPPWPRGTSRAFDGFGVMFRDPPEVLEMRVAEEGRVPWLDVLLGYGAMVPFPVLAVAGWLGWAGAVGGAVLWGGAVLCFLSGVRRGLSFRTPGGPTAAQLAVFAWLFSAGIIALAMPLPAASLLLLSVGYGSLIGLDPVAARRGEAPFYFARLRPWQMVIPVASLLALLPLA